MGSWLVYGKSFQKNYYLSLKTSHPWPVIGRKLPKLEILGPNSDQGLRDRDRTTLTPEALGEEQSRAGRTPCSSRRKQEGVDNVSRLLDPLAPLAGRYGTGPPPKRRASRITSSSEVKTKSAEGEPPPLTLGGQNEECEGRFRAPIPE